ncbi:cholesterol 24-hydroxylase-like [Chaetodon auriga]|uniref:cholesterol 24-hydroxylase-like n=1 Tax=Chaetodon auriga TaxID=39042 RepID=UPI004032C970
MAVFPLILSWAAQALMFLLFLLLFAFLGYCLYIHHIHTKYDHIPGPPRDSFLFGHSPTFLKVMKGDGNLHDKFLEWSERYGPVCRINSLHYVFIAVTCPEATKEILMSPKYPKDKFLYKRLFSLFGQRFLGNGLVTSQDHEQWYKQRRIMDPAFSSLYLRGLMGTFNERAEKLMIKLSDFAETKTEANMLHLVNCVTMDVIAKVAFGVDLDLLNKSSPFPKAIETCLKGMVFYVRDIFFQVNPKNWPFINEVKEACHLLRTTGAKWINERKTAMRNGDDVPKDILTQIIKSAGKEESMTQEDEELMLDNFVTFFIAGQETTANQLAFCVMELARHPDILEKVKKEVDEVIGMKQDISYDDLGELTYLSQVLKETLRIYPTAPGTSRNVLEDIVIAGIHIPGGVTCMFSSYVAGRLEKFFKDPLTFDPDRFHPDAPKPYYSYYPFALGPRSCLGQNFAQMEAKVVMAKLLQRFDFTLLPGQTFDILDTGTLRPKSGVVCSVRHRSHSK